MYNQNYSAPTGNESPFQNQDGDINKPPDSSNILDLINWIMNKEKGPQQQIMNPSDYINQVMSHYKLSSAAQNAITHATTSSEHSGAASGMMGSGEQLQDVQNISQSIMNQDQQSYLNHVLNIDRERMAGKAGVNDLAFQQGQFNQQMNAQQKQGIMNAIGSGAGLMYSASGKGGGSGYPTMGDGQSYYPTPPTF